MVPLLFLFEVPLHVFHWVSQSTIDSQVLRLNANRLGALITRYRRLIKYRQLVASAQRLPVDDTFSPSTILCSRYHR